MSDEGVGGSGGIGVKSFLILSLVFVVGGTVGVSVAVGSPAPQELTADTVSSVEPFSEKMGVGVSSSGKPTPEQLHKLEAFARALGYVRYFHPSDQAALLDWEAFAFFGIAEVLASDAHESTAELIKGLFDPVVVDLEIYSGAEKPRPSTQLVEPSKIIAWQHSGIGFEDANFPYYSARTNRTKTVYEPAASYANLSQSFPVEEHQNQEFRFRFKAKALGKKMRLHGFVRVDRENGEYGFFENMVDRPITSNAWSEYQITGKIDPDGKRLLVGFAMFGNGPGLIDDVHVEWKQGGDWKAQPIKNQGFEIGDDEPDGWNCFGRGYDLKFADEKGATGKRAGQIFRQFTRDANVGGFLDDVPELGEVVDASIAKNLRIRLPLALPIDHAYQPGDDRATDDWLRRVSSGQHVSEDHRSVCLVDVVLAWNIFQHFYAYFEQVETDWDAALNNALIEATRVKSRAQCTGVLRELVAQLHDGHGIVFDSELSKNFKSAPATFVWAENQLVVKKSHDDTLRQGDVISEINGLPALAFLLEKEKQISGSPQWRRFRSTEFLSRADPSDRLTLDVKRGDAHFVTTLEYSNKKEPIEPVLKAIRPLGDSGENSATILYVDLTRADEELLKENLDQMVGASGVIFDLRGHPNDGAEFLLQHMSNVPMQSQKWQVPKQIRPDRVGMKVIETTNRWDLTPEKPKLAGKIVFVTDASAISFAESYLSIVAHYGLGEIIGSPTAGANGNINPFDLPGGYGLLWTGMRVMNHDDSQHHVRGVQPTLLLEPTIAGIREGKDELVDEALRQLKASFNDD